MFGGSSNPSQGYGSYYQPSGQSSADSQLQGLFGQMGAGTQNLQGMVDPALLQSLQQSMGINYSPYLQAAGQAGQQGGHRHLRVQIHRVPHCPAPAAAPAAPGSRCCFGVHGGAAALLAYGNSVYVRSMETAITLDANGGKANIYLATSATKYATIGARIRRE
jgi:hypothetical protein